MQSCVFRVMDWNTEKKETTTTATATKWGETKSVGKQTKQKIALFSVCMFFEANKNSVSSLEEQKTNEIVCFGVRRRQKESEEMSELTFKPYMNNTVFATQVHYCSCRLSFLPPQCAALVVASLPLSVHVFLVHLNCFFRLALLLLLLLKLLLALI